VSNRANGGIIEEMDGERVKIAPQLAINMATGIFIIRRMKMKVYLILIVQYGIFLS